ncbi:hypothetical protein [Microbacterium album]|uniref:Uncharacterized protein n=1 Tax=Microbacterium album TaxID=2053191 RepID=A0A917IAX6_9MICO|nr:hypothetical protein [Microbacterium album]GGH33682.1 hypothetical protein GCM10010921_00820 [Microbacterium album]
MSERVAARPGSLLGINTRPAAPLLVLLLLADAGLILLHLSLKVFGEPSGYTFDLGAERSYGEFMNYLKMLWSAVLLLMLAARHRTPVFAVWAVACVYMLGDDWFQFHEKFGYFFAAQYPELGPLAAHVGELVWMLAAGLVVLVLVLVTHVRAPLEARKISIILLALFTVLAAVAIGLDAVHHMLFSHPVFDVPFTTAEDGGELLVMTVMTAFLFATAVADHRPPLRGLLARIAELPHRS